MAVVVSVRFKSAQRIYYFDPAGLSFEENEGVIVETVRGVEFGRVAAANKDVADSELVLPLKAVIRKATAEDEARNEDNLAARQSLMETATEKVRERGLNMKIADAEYTFDRSKVIVYFTAESRIDFRELVKDLAAAFRIRIELRQIYERDDIKLRGALALCGRPCCCITHLADYEKVSIKMAKLQGLSLNPTKISGCCGKLMCCLKYENDHYRETFHKLPKLKSTVETPDGIGEVTSNDILKETVKVRLTDKEGNSSYKIYPLSALKIRTKQSAEELDD